MDLTCNRERLLHALQLVTRVVLVDQENILSSVKMKTTEASLELAATDMEMYLTTSVPAKIGLEGEILVGARYLMQILRAMTADRIRLQVVDGSLAITESESNFNLHLQALAEYPPILLPQKEDLLTFDADRYRVAFTGAQAAASQNDSRVQLTGFRLESTERGYDLVTTDSYRVHIRHVVETDWNNTGFAVTLPRSVCDLLARIAPDVVHIRMAFIDGTVHIRAGNTYILARQLVGAYPNWRHLLDSFVCAQRFDIDAEAMQQAVKQAGLFASRLNPVKLAWHNKELSMTSTGHLVGAATRKISLDNIVSQKHTAYYDAQYLREAVNACSGDTLVFELSADQQAPLRLIGSSGEIHLLMPVNR